MKVVGSACERIVSVELPTDEEWEEGMGCVDQSAIVGITSRFTNASARTYVRVINCFTQGRKQPSCLEIGTVVRV